MRIIYYSGNVLAPYLMTSVNIDSAKATQIRKAILDMLQGLELILYA